MTQVANEIPIHCSYSDLVEIEKVIPNPRNPNTHPENQVKLLAKIIKAHGWRAPITVSTRSGFVVRGHGRLLAAEVLGLEKVPVDYQPYATEAEEWADLIADNRLSELSEINNDYLKELLRELNGYDLDLELTGYQGEDLDKILAEIQEPAEIKEDNFDLDDALANITEPVTKPGDLWILGRHRIICGDATDKESINRLMNGQQAAMCFTDPPYNVDYTGGTKDALKIKNDNLAGDEFFKLLQDSFQNMFDATMPGGPVYICHAEHEGVSFRRALIEAGWLLKQCIIWVKNGFVIGRQDYQWKHEPILYGWKPGAAHKWYGGRKQSTVIDESVGVSIKQEADGFIITFDNGLQTLAIKVDNYELLQQGDDSDTTIWHFNKPLKNADHPTMKPIGIPARAILNSSKKDEIISDFFLGSGSTLIAAEQTDRICYGMDLDPVYCDVIVNRWEEFTGLKAERISN